jgi:hypothetical protein
LELNGVALRHGRCVSHIGEILGLGPMLQGTCVSTVFFQGSVDMIHSLVIIMTFSSWTMANKVLRRTPLPRVVDATLVDDQVFSPWNLFLACFSVLISVGYCQPLYWRGLLRNVNNDFEQSSSSSSSWTMTLSKAAAAAPKHRRSIVALQRRLPATYWVWEVWVMLRCCERAWTWAWT